MKFLRLSESECLTLQVALRCLQICREHRDRDLLVELANIAKPGDTRLPLEAAQIEALVDKIASSDPPSIHLVITNGLSAECAWTGAIPFASLEGAIAYAEQQICDWSQNSRYEDEIERFLAEFKALDQEGKPVHHVLIGDSEEIFVTREEIRV